MSLRLYVGQYQQDILRLHHSRQRPQGFRDDKFDKIFGGREKLPGFMEELDRAECIKLFDDYMAMSHESY